jgi:CheY-like chemotaxis protein
MELKDLNVLIVDSSGYSKNLLRSILITLGVSQISSSGSAGEAAEELRKQLFHVVFCDENITDPMAFIKSLRIDLNTMNVTIPVILVSSGANFGMVAQWRDAGGSDVIVKPISPAAIQSRLVALVLNPKAFVTARSFVGPDRRRSGDRRQFGERTPAGIDRRSGNQDGVVFATPRVMESDLDMPTRPA